MRVLVLLASYARSISGLADYSSMLATHLIQVGYKVDVVALADVYVESAQSYREGAAKITRIPSALSISAASRYFKTEFAHIEFDFILLNFVLYSWSKKGLPFQLAKLLSQCLGSKGLWGHRVILLHELNIGLDPQASPRERLVGYVQEKLIRHSIIPAYAPDLILTTIPYYAAVLANWNLSAKLLPLFGNIPIVQPKGKEVEEWTLAALGVKRDKYLIYGHFGSIYADVFTETFWHTIKQKAIETSRIPFVVTAGRTSIHYTELLESLCRRYHVEFRRLGQLSERDASMFLHSIHVGLSTTPLALAGKSGSVMAMIEHGKLVVVCRTGAFEGQKLCAKRSSERLPNIVSLTEFKQTLFDVRDNSYEVTPRAASTCSQLLLAVEGI